MEINVRIKIQIQRISQGNRLASMEGVLTGMRVTVIGLMLPVLSPQLSA